jgi:hypothetical protein
MAFARLMLVYRDTPKTLSGWSVGIEAVFGAMTDSDVCKLPSDFIASVDP